MMNINLLPGSGNPPTQKKKGPDLKLGDKVEIVGPFVVYANCQNRRFEGLRATVVALGHLKSDSAFRLCVVEFEDSLVCGVGMIPGANCPPCDHKPYNRVLKSMEIEEVDPGIHPSRRAYKLLSTGNVILLGEHGTQADAEPPNNDGRADCFWCAGPLKRVEGFASCYDICKKCGK